MEWFLFVSVILATPLFAADALNSMEIERVERLERRAPIRLDDVIDSRSTPLLLEDIHANVIEIQAKRDARIGETHEVRISTVKEMMFRLEVAPYVRGRAPRPRRKVHSNFLPKVSK